MKKIDLSIHFVYIINNDLNMSKGKIAAQVSHVAMLIGSFYNNSIIGTAIILKATEQEINKIRYDFNCFSIEDAGLTEVPKGSLTCIGFKENEETKKITKNLKLL